MMRDFQRLIVQFRHVSLALAVASIAVLSDAIPSVHIESSSIQWGHTAQAQTLSDQELRNYASAVLVIEPLRQTAFNEIRTLSGNNAASSIACHRPESITRLNSNVRSIARNYCDRAIRIVEQNDLTIERFNAITQMLGQASRSSDLHQRLQEELIRLQRN
ncbi:MAG TPA: DUF4168 domain-containing protein [Candidatus Obscuribacterales bacterium]